MMTVETPLISIITGFYNRAKILERTIDSLLSQTYGNFELLVFDDNSQDETLSILNSHKYKSDKRLRIISHSNNIGFVSGLIHAVEQSKGEFIAINGSGDTSQPTRLARQAEILRSRPEVTVVGSYYKNILENSGASRLRKNESENYTLKKLATHNPFTHGEVMFRRSAYDEVGGYRPLFKYSQDYDLWVRMRRIGPFATVRLPLYNRYVQFDGVTYSPSKSVEQAMLSSLCQKMASLDNKEALDLYATAAREGPESVVPYNTLAIQKRIMSNAFRLAAWGNKHQSLEMLSYMPLTTKRLTLEAIISASDWPVLANIRRAILRLMGMKL